jgi:hypothetical protein
MTDTGGAESSGKLRVAGCDLTRVIEVEIAIEIKESG